MMRETAIQKAERIKREQNPWEELPRLFAAFRSGVGAIANDDLTNRLRWWGLYTQGDGGGAFGNPAPYFMMRVRIPNGLLTAAQVATIANISRRYGHSIADITTRQNIQLHWLEAEDLPDIMHQLWDAGLTTKSACGDDPRNMTGCPIAGLDPDEYVDASPLTLAVTRAVVYDTNEFYNLPRKYKICVVGCRHWCPNPEINDVAFTAFPRPRGSEPKPGEPVWFGLRVGGALSNAPFIARPLPVKVAWDEVIPVARAITALFRDAAELRQDRGHARLKFLFMRHKWTVEKFQAEMERRLGYHLTPSEPDPAPKPEFRDHLGIHRQKRPGLYFIGASVLRGRISADQLSAIAEAAERFGGSDVRNTAMQNVVIPHVPEDKVDALVDYLRRWDLPVKASAFRRGTMSCTGREFCKLAVVETKAFSAILIDELDRRLPDFPVPIRINLNGCPNSCGQHWIADVGLQGCIVKTPTGTTEGFDVYLGGGLGAGARLSQKTMGRVAMADLADRLEALFRFYLAEREEEESFRDFVVRRGQQAMVDVLGTAPAAEMPASARAHGDLVPAGELA